MVHRLATRGVIVCGAAIAVAGIIALNVHGDDPAPVDGPEAEPQIAIELTCESLTVEQTAYPKYTVKLTNKGDTPVTLVEPGDGSHCGWRTPILTFEAVSSDNSSEKLKIGGPRCGNVNPLKPSEVFALAPGETRALGQWVNPPIQYQPGEFQISVRYVNDPNLKWSGLPLGDHDAAAMKLVKASTPVDVTSNKILLKVTPATKQ